MFMFEWERAVKEAEADFQERVTKMTPLISRELWITSTIHHYGASLVYAIACAFYFSDALDNVPDINGPNRHRVFVDWIGKNTAQFALAIESVEQAARRAQTLAIESLTARLNAPGRHRQASLREG